MKKKYIVPKTEVVDIKMESRLLAGSAKGTDILDGDTGGVGLSREGDLLFEDEGDLLFEDEDDIF